MQKNITDAEREAILKAVQFTIDSKAYSAVNNALLKTLLYQVTHPPKRGNKWAGVRWLLSEMAQFALRDFELNHYAQD
jgi:hypothetical protein